MRCGLLGEHLGHSYSPQIHGALADYSYELSSRSPLKRWTPFSALTASMPSM